MSILATRLEDFRAQSPLDKWETRADRWGFYELFRKQSNDVGSIITPDLQQKALDAVGSGLEVPVFNYDASVSVTNVTIPLTISDQLSTSALVAITFTNYFFGFQIHPAKHKNNSITMQREFNEKLQKCVFELLNTWNDDCETVLSTNKTQVLADDLGGRYTLTSDVAVAALADQDFVMGDVNILHHANKYMGPFDIVANSSMESLVRNRLLEKQQFNDSNKTYQWSDKNFFFANSLTNAAGHKATAYAVQQGSVGILDQFAPDCLMGHSTRDGHIWGIETIPILGSRMGTYFYDGAANISGGGAHVAHLTATKAEHYGFHVAKAFLHAYSSDLASIASPTLKFAVATT